MRTYPYRIYYQWGGTNLSLRERYEECPNVNGKQCIVLMTQNGNRCDEVLHHSGLIELIKGKKCTVVKNTLRRTVLNKELFKVILEAQLEIQLKALSEAQKTA